MNPSSVPALFTAAEYASVIRCSLQYVRKLLKRTPVTGKKIPRRACSKGDCIAGKMACAWEIGSLPSPLIQRLAKLAQKHGCSSPLELMLNPPSATATVVTLARVSHIEIERAQKLQRAFGSCLALPAEASTSERARIAAPHYEREFGKEVGDRYLRKLIDRILERDAGACNFADLRLYIASSDAHKRSAPRRTLSGRFDFRELDDQLIAISKRARPSLKDKAFCWRKIVEFYHARVKSGADAVALKRQLREYVLNALPFLSDSPDAVKRSLNRKLRDEAELGAEALVDGRTEPKGDKAAKRVTAHFENDFKLLAQRARFHCGSRISQAYRELHDGRCHNGERLSEEFRETFSFNCRKAKSRVPEPVRRVVTPMVKAMGPLRLGTRAAKLALPSIQRDWSNVAAGDSYTSDDVTLNHYVYDWSEAGEYEFEGQRFNVMRPQFLPVVDERTELPLGFSLIPQRNYTSWHIKTLMSRVCMRPEIGLPFKQFIFELSIWDSRNVNALAEWTEIDESFARNGIALKVRHATTPKAKIIEGVIGRLQNLDEYHPAYIGRGEQQVKYERVHEFLRALKRFGQPLKADVYPGEMLMSLGECAELMEKVMVRFADEPQNGERLPVLARMKLGGSWQSNGSIAFFQSRCAFCWRRSNRPGPSQPRE